MSKFYFLALVAVCLLVGCTDAVQNDDDNLIVGDTYDYDYTAYVYSYTYAEKMELRPTDQIFEFEREVGEGLSSRYGFQVLFETHEEWYNVLITHESNPILYDSLCVKHNDLNYNRTISWYDPNFPHNYLAFDLRSIQVTSNVDFDEQHSAGTSLNDIVQFIAYTPYPFIQSSYQYNHPNQISGQEELTLIDKPLSECTQEDFILTLGQKDNCLQGYFPSCYLVLKMKPTLAQEHKLTVFVVDDAGKTWQASIDMDWGG